MFQVIALQEAYDDLCVTKGNTAVPYFLIKYTDHTVQMAPLEDWESFFTMTKKVATFICFIGKVQEVCNFKSKGF